MKWINRIAYGVGQMLKDLVGSTMSAFSIIFYEGCLGIPQSSVGAILLAGQVVNALATPLIGFLSDRTPTVEPKKLLNIPSEISGKTLHKPTWWSRLKRQLALGKRKSWHLAGSVLMLIAFPCIFGQPESMINLPLWAKCLINAILYIVVQIGWAAIQIPHLSIINDLASSLDERVILASLRYFFGSIADISIFVLCYAFFYKRQAAETSKNQELYNQTVSHYGNLSITAKNMSAKANFERTHITASDMPFFRDISLLVAGLGALFVIIFHCGVREKSAVNGEFTSSDFDVDSVEKEELGFPENEKINTFNPNSPKSLNPTNQVNGTAPKFTIKTKSQMSVAATTLRWYDWFKQVRFWLGCSVFTTTRLSASLAIMYINPFLLTTLGMEKSSIVSVPLVFSISCLLTTLVQQKASHYLGNFINSLMGILLMLAYCTLIFFLEPGFNNQIMVHLAAALLGTGATISNVRAVTVIANLIGNSQVSTAAFVHGIASFTEKLCTGLVLQIIQFSLPVLNYRHVEVFIVGGLIILAGILSTVSRFMDQRNLAKLTATAIKNPTNQESTQDDVEGNATTITTTITNIETEDITNYKNGHTP